MTQRDHQRHQRDDMYEQDRGQGQFGGSGQPAGQHQQGGGYGGQQGGHQGGGYANEPRGRHQGGEQSFQRDYGARQQQGYSGGSYAGDYGGQQGGYSGSQGGYQGGYPGGYQGGYQGGYPRDYGGASGGYGDQGWRGPRQWNPQGGHMGDRADFQGSYPRSAQYEPIGGYGDQGSSAGVYAGPGDSERDYLRHTQGRGSQGWPEQGYQRGYFGGYQSGGGFEAGSNEQFDPDYHQWRSEQIRNLDEDYRSWRNDRYKKFADEFNTWRSQRSAGGSGTNTGSTSGNESTPSSKSK